MTCVARTRAPGLRGCPLLLLVCVLAVSGCADSNDRGRSADQTLASEVEAGPAWFEDRATDHGLTFVHDWGHDDLLLMPEIMAGGAAFFDADNDGDLDAYLVQSGSILPRNQESHAARNRLFLNDGRGRFSDRTAEGGDAGDSGYGMGVATGDVDGDGRVDLYVTNLGRDTLLINRGDGVFEDRTEAAGLGDELWGAGATFFDFDRDGDLDLFVATYLDWSPSSEIDCYGPNGWQVFCSPQSYDAPTADILYRNEGHGTFRNISTESGIGARAGTGLGVAVGDFDGDGLGDVFVANDGMPDHLWVNEGDGTFREDAAFLGCAFDQQGRPKAGMGVAVGDLDRDGDQDLMVCNLRQETDSVFRNDGGVFSDITSSVGLGTTNSAFTRFGMGWRDLNNDGWLDLYQANGRVTRFGGSWSDTDPYAEPNLLFRGAPAGFSEVTPRGGTTRLELATSRGAAFGDVNGDGGVDILISNNHGQANLLINTHPQRGNWVILRVLNRSGAPALGAKLDVSWSSGAQTRHAAAEVRSSSSYLSASDPSVHFGLGDAVAVDDVTVRWPDGRQSEHGSHEAGQIVEIRQPQ